MVSVVAMCVYSCLPGLLDDEPVDWAEGVAMQLTLLNRDTDGKLTRDGYVGATMRAAVFVDLAFDGRIERGEQSWIDCEPVNFAPVDRLLTAISRHDDGDRATFC